MIIFFRFIKSLLLTIIFFVLFQFSSFYLLCYLYLEKTFNLNNANDDYGAGIVVVLAFLLLALITFLISILVFFIIYRRLKIYEPCGK